MEKEVSEKASTVSVYLVAQNRLLRETLVRLFQKRSGICVVGESRCSDSSSVEIAKANSDLVLLDSLGSPESVILVEELNQRLPLTKIILFGMDEDTDCFLRAVRLGIRGYLLKDASSMEIISAVQGVMRGEAACPPKLCAQLFEIASGELRRKFVSTGGQRRTSLSLTHRQRELMRLVEEGRTNKEIAACLNLSEFTVRNHISRVMKRVDADTRYEAVEVIRTNVFSRIH